MTEPNDWGPTGHDADPFDLHDVPHDGQEHLGQEWDDFGLHDDAAPFHGEDDNVASPPLATDEEAQGHAGEPVGEHDEEPVPEVSGMFVDPWGEGEELPAVTAPGWLQPDVIAQDGVLAEITAADGVPGQPELADWAEQTWQAIAAGLPDDQPSVAGGLAGTLAAIAQHAPDDSVAAAARAAAHLASGG